MWWWAVQYRRLPTYGGHDKDGHAKPLPSMPPYAGLCRAILTCIALIISVMLVPMVHEVVVMLRHSDLVRSRLQSMGTHALELAIESRPHTHVQPLPLPGLPGCAHAYVEGHEVHLTGQYALLASVTEVVKGGSSNTIDMYAMGALKLRVALGNRTHAAGIDTILLVASASATCRDAGRGLGNGLYLAFLAGWDAVCCVAPDVLGMDGKEDLSIVPQHLRHDFNRFLAWGLDRYSLVMYLDSDTSILEPDGVVAAFPGVHRGMASGGLSYACRKVGHGTRYANLLHQYTRTRARA